MLLEFIQHITESQFSSHIEHPEDLIFIEGSAGAMRAITALNDVATHPQNLKIKFDGFPALVFGRNHEGKLIVTDKHMFAKKDGTGLVTSPEEFKQYDMSRGVNREDLYEKIRVLFSALEQIVPNEVGYYWGDLLWVGKLRPIKGQYVFKPNTVTYSVNAASSLGQRIASSIGGIVVHQYFSDVGQAPRVLQDTGKLNLNGTVAIMSPNIEDIVKLKNPISAISQVSAAIKSSANQIDALLNRDSLASIKCTDLGALMKRYMNARVKGFNGPFAQWIVTNVSQPKLVKLTGDNGYLTQHDFAVQSIFAIAENIQKIKSSLITQLDQQQHTIQSFINGVRAGEGYVFNSSTGMIKLVNRDVFSKANFANNP